MLFQQFDDYWKKREISLLFTSIFFALGFFSVGLDWLKVDEELNVLLMGTSTVLLCIGLERTSFRSINPWWYLVGSAGFYYGLFDMLKHSPLEILFLAAACGGVFLSTWVRSRVLLSVSTITILAYISYFTSEHFQDSLGWPLVLILLGFVFIGLSALAIRINKRYISQP